MTEKTLSHYHSIKHVYEGGNYRIVFHIMYYYCVQRLYNNHNNDA